MPKRNKSSVKRRSVNVGGGSRAAGRGSGARAGEQDVKRRLGNFVGAGEHARVGGREGIGGQRPGKFRTDNRKKT